MFKLLSFGENRKSKKGAKAFDNNLDVIISAATASTSSCTNEETTNEEKEQILASAELHKGFFLIWKFFTIYFY